MRESSKKDLSDHFQRLDMYFQSTIRALDPEMKALLQAFESLELTDEYLRNNSRLEISSYLEGYAAFSGDLSDIMNYNFSFGTLLQMAAQFGRDDLIDVFIYYGANINAIGDNGYRAIHTAAMFEQTTILRALLERGAYIDSTALDLALVQANIEILNLLIPNQSADADHSDAVAAPFSNAVATEHDNHFDALEAIPSNHSDAPIASLTAQITAAVLSSK